MTRRPFKAGTPAASRHERNKARAAWAERALAYAYGCGPSPIDGRYHYCDEWLVDLLTDLMHLCDRRARLDFEQCLTCARRHFEEEVIQ